ncbi:pfs [Fusarium proliferatum]|nr:pfs [Fusarium proliferatum]
MPGHDIQLLALNSGTRLNKPKPRLRNKQRDRRHGVPDQLPLRPQGRSPIRLHHDLASLPGYICRHHFLRSDCHRALPKAGDDQLRSRLQCLVSIGTGVPALKPVRNDVLGIGATLTSLATETEKTAEQFRRDKSSLDDEGRYYRFNVSRGLEHVGLAESKKQRDIAAATGRITNQPSQDFGPFKTPFSLDGVPASDKFVARPADTAELEKCLLPQRSHARRTGRKIFVLFGLGGVGKTQLSIDFARRHQAAFSSVFWLDGRSEDQLKQSIAGCISKIPKDQVPETSRR